VHAYPLQQCSIRYGRTNGQTDNSLSIHTCSNGSTASYIARRNFRILLDRPWRQKLTDGINLIARWRHIRLGHVTRYSASDVVILAGRARIRWPVGEVIKKTRSTAQQQQQQQRKAMTFEADRCAVKGSPPPQKSLPRPTIYRQKIRPARRPPERCGFLPVNCRPEGRLFWRNDLGNFYRAGDISIMGRHIKSVIIFPRENFFS